MTHPWMNWLSLVNNGRIRGKGISQPRRERLLMRAALTRLGLRYKEIIPVINYQWTGWKNRQTNGTIQWIDFLYLMPNGRMGAILLDPHYGQGGVKKHEWAGYYAKQDLLKRRGIPVLLLKRTQTSQEYEILIRKFNERIGGRNA